MTFFDALMGQKEWKRQLTTLIEESTLPHSLLIHGEIGMESIHMAIAVASSIIGRQVFSADGGQNYLEQIKQWRLENGESEKSVEDKGLPLYIDKGDAFWIRPTKTQLRIDQWHTLLENYVQQASDTPRVVIIEDFQTANAVFANAMLKTIEEPPKGMYFILITTHMDQVLPTIVSRCMCITMQPVEEQELIGALQKEGFQGDLLYAVRAGRGNPMRARQWAQEGQIESLEKAMCIMERVVEKNHFFTTISLELIQDTPPTVVAIFEWLRIIGRDMLALRHGVNEESIIAVSYRHRMETILPKWSSQALQSIVPITLDGEKALRLHIRLGLVLDGVILRLRQSVKEDI